MYIVLGGVQITLEFKSPANEGKAKQASQPDEQVNTCFNSLESGQLTNPYTCCNFYNIVADIAFTVFSD